jgi:hypothetical protein
MQHGFENQLRAVDAMGNLASAADRAGDEFLAMVGQYTNEI